jgi:hypothetical protein
LIETAIAAALGAALVGVASQLSRVWGHGLGGLLSAFPLIVGPVLLLAALRHDRAFAAHAARSTLLGLVALCGFALAYGRASRRAGWAASLAIAWAAAAALGILAARIETGVLGALAAAMVSIVVARATLSPALSPAREVDVASALPRWDLPARMALTALLIVGLTAAAERFGPAVAGALSALPALASVLAVFTHARHGRDALLTLLRGMLSGLAAFVTFCALIGLMIERAGVALAFVLATAAAALVHAAAGMRLSRAVSRSRG